jgi:hypothetical protein
MNEGDEAIESTETRKKRRRSGFRYSSRKVLERSRVKRETAKVGGVQFEAVTRTLSYPSEICDIVHHDCAARSMWEHGFSFFCSRPQVSTKTGSLKFGNK